MTAPKTAKDLKNERKEAERAAAAEERKAKEAEEQKKIVEEFNAKQEAAKAETEPVKKLKAWLVNPPFKSTDEALKVSLELASQELTVFVYRRKRPIIRSLAF